MTNRDRTDYLLLGGFCAFLFFYGLGQFGLIGADEPRYAQVAREMFERLDWITPVLGGQPWLEKPPLYYWQAMLAFRIFGVTDWAARLPSAVDASIMVLGVYVFLRRFCAGFQRDGALITASCAGIIGYARAASMDITLASALTVGLLAWWTWKEGQGRLYLALFYASLALGMLAKGPVAPFLAATVIVFYAVAARETRLMVRTLWIPGILLFCAIALPWYVAVQLRNPQFFRIFILEHNLARFSTDLYHHPEPIWYYIPVFLLALVPWTVFQIAALIRAVRLSVGSARKTTREFTPAGEDSLSLFASCWLIVPVAFFSLSRSKLPGYILPAISAAAVLLAVYLRQRAGEKQAEPTPTLLAVLQALVASAPIVPALLIQYLLTQNRLPGGRPLIASLGVAFILAAGIALTLTRRRGLSMLYFVTLIPVLLTVAAVLKIGSATIDQTLSARPVAAEISSLETHRMTLAVYGVPRETEYGLTFYRNQVIVRYEWGHIPVEEHLLVARENAQAELAKQALGRRISYLGHFAPQNLDYYWVSAAGAASHR